MIDEITFTGPAPSSLCEGEIPPGFTLSRPPGKGRPAQWSRSLDRGVIWIGYEPDLLVVEVRLSVPRWVQQQKLANYPLPAIRSVQDLRPQRLALRLAEAFGVRVCAMGDEWKSAFPVHRWAVVQVSYSLDLPVSDPGTTLTGLCGLKRKHGAKPVAYGSPTETLMWKSGGTTVRLYNKAEELRSRWRKHPDQRPLLENLANHAKNIIRFEVVLSGVKPIRNLWKGIFNLPRRALPTLALMTRPEIATLVWRREIVRLDICEHDAPLGAETLGLRVRNIAIRLAQYRRVITRDNKLRKRTRLTKHRLGQLLLAHVALSGMTRREAQHTLGWSESKLYDLLADLRALGLPPDGSPTESRGEAATELARALAPRLLPAAAVSPEALLTLARSLPGFTAPPWPDRNPVDEDGPPEEPEAEVEMGRNDIAVHDWESVIDILVEDDAPEGDYLDVVDDSGVGFSDFEFDPALGDLVRMSA